MSESIQKFTVSIPLDYGKKDREIIGKLIIRRIQERTKEGISKFGKKFPSPKYSDEYASSLDFKIAGKSKGNVDLQQSGDMLGAIDILNDGDGFLTIGYEAGLENDKAAWQQENTRASFPKRKFLGITEKELNEILSQVTPIEDLSTKQEAKREKEYESDKAVETMADKIFKLWGV